MNISPHCRAIIFPSNELISCAVCNELLDVYLDAELTNINVKYAYTEVWQHLQACESCATYHAWLYTQLRKRPASSLSHACQNQFDLSFLPFREPQIAPVVPETGWDIYLRPRLLGEPFLLRLALSVDYLQAKIALFAAAPINATLATEHPQPPCILLKQHISLPEQEIVVKLLAYPLSVPLGLVRLQAILTTPFPLLAKLQAKLQWGRRERIVQMTETGMADLGLVSLPPGQSVNRTEDIFTITFEAIHESTNC